MFVVVVVKLWVELYMCVMVVFDCLCCVLFLMMFCVFVELCLLCVIVFVMLCDIVVNLF